MYAYWTENKALKVWSFPCNKQGRNVELFAVMLFAIPTQFKEWEI